MEWEDELARKGWTPFRNGYGSPCWRHKDGWYARHTMPSPRYYREHLLITTHDRVSFIIHLEGFTGRMADLLP